MSAAIHFLSGPLAGKRVTLTAEQISVGRAEGCSIRLDDESVALRHLVLIRDDDGYSVFIDASKPPVAVNGKQIINASLKTGDVLQIGTVRARFKVAPPQKKGPSPLDFADVAVRPPKKKPVEILSLDDAEELPLEDDDRRDRKGMRIAIALGVLMLMLGGSVIAFRKEFWRNPDPPSTASTPTVVEEQEPEKVEEKTEPKKEEEPPEPPPPLALGIGAGPSGLKEKAKVLRTRLFKSHQEAVNSARPGDAVIFDSFDPRPIVITKPLRDVQFLSGEASWEIHADLIDCQFLFHTLKYFHQKAGKAEQCAFYRCPMKRTRFIHADAVSFYFDQHTPLPCRDSPVGGATLLLSGYVRNVLIHNPQCGVNVNERRFDTNYGQAVRIHATDPEGDGRGTFILRPVVQGQRAWTPFEVTQGNGVTFAHLTADGSVWADPVFRVVRGNDCVLLSNAFAGESPTTIEQFQQSPKSIRYHDHVEFGYDNGPAFRGAAMTVTGMRTRIVAHGDARRPWTVGRRMALPGLHYADGVVVADPYVTQFVTDQGGLSLDLVEMKGAFVQLPDKDGATFLSVPEQPDGGPLYPRRGPALFQPVFVPLKDLRVTPGEFDRVPLIDMSAKPVAEIETALNAGKAVYLGPGNYEFKQPIRAGLLVGAGMEKTVLKWPDDADCVQRPCRGLLNCTVSGGRVGFNGSAGPVAKVPNPSGTLIGADCLFLRTRFAGQKEAAINLAAASFQTFQDCEFVGCRDGIVCREDGTGVKKTQDTPPSRPIDNLDILNCTFQKVGRRAIDLAPQSPQLGHVGVHNCLFDSVGDSAIRIEGGQTHLVQQCRLQGCASQSYAPAISVWSHGTVALAHVDIDSTGVKGNAVCVALKGLAATSRCTFKGMPTSLKCDGLLAADRVTANGDLQAGPGSILCHCRFKNMTLPDGTAIAKAGGFTDVSAALLPLANDVTPPPVVQGVKARSSGPGKLIEWDPADDPESGISSYVVFSDGREIARVNHHYDAPSDIHSPLFKLSHATSYFDTNPANRNYEVVAINGAGLASDGKLVPLRRLGPARAKFLTRDGDPVVIKDFVAPKGKMGLLVVDELNNRIEPARVGLKGRPNSVVFEAGTLVESP